MVRKSEILLFFRNFYTVVEDLLGFSNGINGPLQVILTSTAVFIATILLVIFLTPFLIFYHCLNFYLKWKIGDSYVGLLKGQDSSMECKSKKLVINILMVINRNTAYDDFVKCVVLHMKKGQQSCAKLSYLIDNCLGYYYFTKGHLKIEDYLSILDYSNEEFISKEMLHGYLRENCFDDRLLKNKMWHMTMFKQPIKWSGNADLPQHTFVCTIRHSLCDGISVLGLLKNKVFQGMEVAFAEVKTEKDRSIAGGRYVYQNCFLPLELNARINPCFRTGEFLSLFAEETVQYVPLVKEVKKKLNVQFSDVLVAAIASALISFAKKKNIKLARQMGSIAISPYATKNKQLLNGDFNFDNVSNTNGVLQFNIPEITSLSMVEKTLKIHKIMQKALRASEVVVVQSLLKLFYLIPTPLLAILFAKETAPTCFELSNMSGIENWATEKCSLESAIFFTTQLFKVGFMFGVLTLGEKFQMSLKVNEGLVENQEEVDEILRDVFRYLDVLREEIRYIENGRIIK